MPPCTAPRQRVAASTAPATSRRPCAALPSRQAGYAAWPGRIHGCPVWAVLAGHFRSSETRYAPAPWCTTDRYSSNGLSWLTPVAIEVRRAPVRTNGFSSADAWPASVQGWAPAAQETPRPAYRETADWPRDDPGFCNPAAVWPAGSSAHDQARHSKCGAARAPHRSTARVASYGPYNPLRTCQCETPPCEGAVGSGSTVHGWREGVCALAHGAGGFQAAPTATSDSRFWIPACAAMTVVLLRAPSSRPPDVHGHTPTAAVRCRPPAPRPAP